MFEQQIQSIPVKDDAIVVVALPRAKFRALGAVFASAVVPGAGHLILGRWRAGMCLVSCFAMLIVCFWPLRFLQFYDGFLALFGGWIALFLYAMFSTQLYRNQVTGLRLSRWWFVVTLPVVVIALSFSGAAVTRASGFRSFSVPSTSMEPTIRRGDQIVADTWRYRQRHPQSREVIIFKSKGIYFIKRVAAVGGDTIEGRDKAIFVNGKLLNESYIQHTEGPVPGYEWMNRFGPTQIPVGEYFVIGDNRDVSLDSRSPDFGLVDENSIIGKPLYVIHSDREGSNIR